MSRNVSQQAAIKTCCEKFTFVTKLLVIYCLIQWSDWSKEVQLNCKFDTLLGKTLCIDIENKLYVLALESNTWNSESRIVFPNALNALSEWYRPKCKSNVSSYLDNYSYSTTTLQA